MGVSDLLDIIIGTFIVLIVSVALWHFDGNIQRNTAIANLAQETAYDYVTYANALNAYVDSNFNNNITGTVSCSTLQSDNFLSSSFSCSDPLGETISGFISEPWGFPQTWIVAPTSSPNVGILAKYGLNNSLQWKAFTYQVSVDAMKFKDSYKAFSINNGNFVLSESDNSSNLSDYFPSSGTEFSQTMPDISYFDSNSFIVSPNIQKNPSYWVFSVDVNNDYNNSNPASSPSSITYENLGENAVCPLNGYTPQVPSNWSFNINSISSGQYNYGEYIPNQTNYYNKLFYICIPAPNRIINTTSQIFQNIGPITSLDYGSDEMANNGTTFNGSNNSTTIGMAPQVGQVYEITEGMAKYTFFVFLNFYSSGYYSNGTYDNVWGSYGSAGGAFYIGFPSSNNTICIESDSMQPAQEVTPNIYPPCWNAINDLGLTDINL
jgi:hypothetical protein